MKRGLILLAMLVGLSGCAGADLVKLPTGEIVNAATDRWGSWERVRKDEEATKQEVAKAEAAKAVADAAKASGRENVQIIINTQEALQTYALSRANDNLAEANRILGHAVDALAGGGSAYKDLSTTPMPQGAFAEGIEAAGNAVSKVANTPVALAVGVGVATKWVAKEVGDSAGDRYDAGHDVTLKDSGNRTESTMSHSDESSMESSPDSSGDSDNSDNSDNSDDHSDNSNNNESGSTPDNTRNPEPAPVPAEPTPAPAE